MTDQAAADGANPQAARIDKLLDAIELVKADQRDAARHLLRDLIRDDSDFEHAWLWMSVSVDTLDQSAVCLDNVLRINPNNGDAASAYYRISIPEIQMHARRARLRLVRDLASIGLWGMVVMMVALVWIGIGEAMEAIMVTPMTPTP
ncbi:MAG: hypothetical protein SGJ24_18790 [Chloroflexota bacterium]|nr:hypothetical protein [Chloroflexota bacterium]